MLNKPPPSADLSAFTQNSNPLSHPGAGSPPQKRPSEISPGLPIESPLPGKITADTKVNTCNRVFVNISISLTPEMLAAVEARVRELRTEVSSRSHFFQRLIQLELQHCVLSSACYPLNLPNPLNTQGQGKL